jgi:hypothetical protein
MKSRWAMGGLLSSCALLTVYWVSSSSLPDQPRYGLYSRRFVNFIRSYPIPGYADQYQFLDLAEYRAWEAASLGVPD